MVSPSQPSVSVPSFTGVNRGFIPEETIVATGPGAAQITYYRPFWRPVLAGTLVTLALFALSWYLMLGLHIGVDSDGFLDLGVGAAIWLWLTSCAAFFVGGLIANAMTIMPDASTDLPLGSATIKGLVIWGLSLPLALVIYAVVAQGAPGVLAALNLPHPAIVRFENVPGSAHLGFYWSMFIGMGLGLILAVAGSMAACAVKFGAYRISARTAAR